MNTDSEPETPIAKDDGGELRQTIDDLTGTKANELVKTREQDSFELRLGRAFQNHFRWWHIGLILALPTFAGFRYSIGYFFGLLAIEMLIAFCALLFHWLTDDLKRARGTIMFLVMLPLFSKLGKWIGPQVPIGDNQFQRHSNSESLPKIDKPTLGIAYPDRLQRQNATLTYWQTAVASLHEIRFHMPTGDEPASQFYDRMYDELGKLTSRAESAPTTSVDQDLLDLARRHLAIERRLLLANVKTGQLLKEAGVPAGADTISDRIAQGEGLVTAALANSTLLDKIPEGELKALFIELLDLEKQRLEQFREIEIMQAVLQERYSGTKFLLPKVN